MSIKHNIVFVKNKLITLDTILPFLIELKKDYNLQYPKFSKFHGNKPKKFNKVGDNCFETTWTLFKKYC